MTHSDAQSSSASLDPQVMARLRALAQDTDPALFAEILNTYKRDAEKYFEAVREALAKNDAATLERNAHALKGASINAGALGVARVSSLVESSAGSGELGSAASMLQELADEIERVKNDIALELSSIG